jgi:hypothetical protein
MWVLVRQWDSRIVEMRYHEASGAQIIDTVALPRLSLAHADAMARLIAGLELSIDSLGFGISNMPRQHFRTAQHALIAGLMTHADRQQESAEVLSVSIEQFIAKHTELRRVPIVQRKMGDILRQAQDHAKGIDISRRDIVFRTGHVPLSGNDVNLD